MKKIIFILVIFFVVSAVSLSAWEGKDLTKFPPCMNEKNWILNLGIGLGLDSFDHIGDDKIWFPPVRLSFDKNVGIGDNNLPFFFGGIIRYTGHGHKKHNYYYHVIGLGFRAGYHFNWAVDKLDTYAVTTAGWTVYAGDNDWAPSKAGSAMVGVNLGARWFVSDGFGFWVEAGTGHILDFVPHFDIGFAFKF
ncbi:MAG: hypothetical protein FWD22_06885 [Treponema sp.]|nr:hypothetical protein [Treponema sp.]